MGRFSVLRRFPAFYGQIKYSINKTLFKEGRFVFVVIISLFVVWSLIPRPVEAGLFSDVWRFLAGGTENDSKTGDLPLAAISLPLLGSQKIATAGADGVGGPRDVSPLALSIVQDSAFIASRNPLGTLPDSIRDQILVYTVQPGDVPGAIAEKFGISLNTLLWANNITNPNLIRIGDELVILPVTGVKYEIKKGDTIESIAKEFKGEAADILAFNGLAIGEPLQVGATIIIPDGEVALPPSPPSYLRQPRVSGLPEFSGYYMRPIFGGRKSRGIHGFNGVDLANACGFPVVSSAEGTIIIVRASGWNGGYGKYVVVAHSNGTQTLYAHLSSILGRVGQKIAQGSQIATIGSTGNSTGCHVHFEVRGAKNPF